MERMRQAQLEAQLYRQGQQKRINADQQEPPENWRQTHQALARKEKTHHFSEATANGTATR